MHFVWVGSLEGAAFSIWFGLMVLVSGGLEGAALPFAVVWACGFGGGRCCISFGC